MAKHSPRATPASSPIPVAVAERAGFHANGNGNGAAAALDADPGDELFDQFLNELDAPDMVVYLSRQDPISPREFGHLDVVDGKDFSLEYVKSRFGGGRYRARPRRETKPYQWGRQITFSIDARLFPPRTQPAESPAPAPAPPAISPDMAELRAMMKDLTATVVAALTTRPAAQADPLEMALKIAEVMKPAGPSHSVAEILTLVESARSNGIHLGKQLADHTPPDDSLLAFAREVTPPILTALSKPSTSATPQPPAKPALALVRGDRPAPPAPPAAAASAPASTEAPSTVNLNIPSWARSLQPWIPQLMQKMQQGKNPAVYAHLLLEELPADVYANVAAASTAPDFEESVLNAVPALNEPGRREWFAEFLTEIRETIAADAAAERDDQDDQEDQGDEDVG